MEIDLNSIIEQRKIDIHCKITELDKLKDNLRTSEPFEFSISEIREPLPRKKGQRVGIESLNELENIKYGVVYIFEIVDEEIKSSLLDKIGNFRSKENKNTRSTAKIPQNAKDNKSNILYVGSVENNIHTRIRQHLGFGHPHTFALQLKHWADEEWKFKLYYIEINNKIVLKEIEAQISKELNPLVGKREK